MHMTLKPVFSPQSAEIASVSVLFSQTLEGTVPVMSFPLIFNIAKLVKLPNSTGIDPVKLFESSVKTAVITTKINYFLL